MLTCSKHDNVILGSNVIHLGAEVASADLGIGRSSVGSRSNGLDGRSFKAKLSLWDNTRYRDSRGGGHNALSEFHSAKPDVVPSVGQGSRDFSKRSSGRRSIIQDKLRLARQWKNTISSKLNAHIEPTSTWQSLQLVFLLVMSHYSLRMGWNNNSITPSFLLCLPPILRHKALIFLWGWSFDSQG